MDKQKYTKAEVIEAIRVSGGFVTEAAKKLNCTPATVYNYIDRFPEIKQIREAISESYLDFAESQLIQLIKEKDFSAICFFLKCKGKARGYIERPAENSEAGKMFDGIEFELVTQNHNGNGNGNGKAEASLKAWAHTTLRSESTGADPLRYQRRWIQKFQDVLPRTVDACQIDLSPEGTIHHLVRA